LLPVTHAHLISSEGIELEDMLPPLRIPERKNPSYLDVKRRKT